MESYCVIHFQDKEEQVKILTFLAVETNAMYFMTADLMEYASKLIQVKIEDSAQEDKTMGSTEVEKIPEAVTQDESLITNYIEPPTIDDDTDEHGTNVPYLERTFEPKEEVMDEYERGDDRWLIEMEREQEVMREQEGGDINLDIDSEIIDDTTIDKDTPSTSTKRRSGRIKKRTEVDIEDESTEKSSISTTKRRHKDDSIDEDLEVKNVKMARRSIEDNCIDNDTCQKCGQGKLDYNGRRLTHSAGHTKILRFECGADGCDVKSNHHGQLKKHFLRDHSKKKLVIKDVKLTKQQTDELNKMAKECFPNANFEEYAVQCQLCPVKIRTDSHSYRYNHAIKHVDFMLYKCVESGCQFETKYLYAMTSHERASHEKKGDSELTRFQLSEKEEMEIEKMMKKCFPVVKYNYL